MNTNMTGLGGFQKSLRTLLWKVASALEGIGVFIVKCIAMCLLLSPTELDYSTYASLLFQKQIQNISYKCKE